MTISPKPFTSSCAERLGYLDGKSGRLYRSSAEKLGAALEPHYIFGYLEGKRDRITAMKRNHPQSVWQWIS